MEENISSKAISQPPTSNTDNTLLRQNPKEKPRILHIKKIKTALRKCAAIAETDRGRKSTLTNPTIDTGTQTALHIIEEKNGSAREQKIKPKRKNKIQETARRQLRFLHEDLYENTPNPFVMITPLLEIITINVRKRSIHNNQEK